MDYFMRVPLARPLLEGEMPLVITEMKPFVMNGLVGALADVGGLYATLGTKDNPEILVKGPNIESIRQAMGVMADALSDWMPKEGVVSGMSEQGPFEIPWPNNKG